MEAVDRMAKRIFILLLGLALLPALAPAATYQVSEVTVRGNQRVDRGAILAAISARAGAVSDETVDKDLRAIFKLGRFADVSALVEERDGAKVLVFEVKERPLVRKVTFSGNEEIKEEKLRSLVTLRTPNIYDPREVSRSVEAIIKAYVEEGYYAAAVEPKVEISERNEATVAFAIREGEKVLIDRIAFEGNRVFKAKELKKVIETKERWVFSWITGRGKYQEEVLQNDLEIIADQYFNKGYVRVKVKQPMITLSPDKKYMDVLIEIEEGDQFRVGTVEVEGDLLVDREQLLSLSKLKEGDVFSRALLRESVFALNDLYADQGYAYVNVSPLTQIQVEERRIDLAFDIEQGIQVHVDRIRISGNTKTRDKVIRREMKLDEGDLYSSTKLKTSRQRINNLGFFEEVKVSTSKGSDEGHMNLDVEVKERPTGTFTLGFGYSSVDGILGQGSVQQDNFLGRALKLNLAGSFGGKSTTYQAGILDPYFLDTRLSLGGDLYNTDREYTEFSKKTTGGDVKFGFPVSENSRAFFVYRLEEKEIYDVDSDASSIIRDQEGTSTLSSIHASWTRDVTDYRLDPSSGSVTMVSAEIAGLGGTEKFAKYIGDYRHFVPFKWGTVFSAHGQIGYIQQVGGEEIPLDERFFLGGLTSVRGFKARRVGPRVRRNTTVVDPVTGSTQTFEATDFDYIGGDKEAFFNLEYTFPLLQDAGLKGLLFYDIGNAWEEGEEMFSDMRSSTGFGIRWLSPMGPLRLEWGYNLDPREDEENSIFEFSIGRFF